MRPWWFEVLMVLAQALSLALMFAIVATDDEVRSEAANFYGWTCKNSDERGSLDFCQACSAKRAK